MSSNEKEAQPGDRNGFDVEVFFGCAEVAVGWFRSSPLGRFRTSEGASIGVVSDTRARPAKIKWKASNVVYSCEERRPEPLRTTAAVRFWTFFGASWEHLLFLLVAWSMSAELRRDKARFGEAGTVCDNSGDPKCLLNSCWVVTHFKHGFDHGVFIVAVRSQETAPYKVLPKHRTDRDWNPRVDCTRTPQKQRRALPPPGYQSTRPKHTTKRKRNTSKTKQNRWAARAALSFHLQRVSLVQENLTRRAQIIPGWGSTEQ